MELALITIVLGTASAAHGFGQRLPENDDPVPAPAPAPTPKPPATPAPAPTTGMTPLWESKATDGKKWTAHVMKQLDVLGEDILDVMPADAATFCPRYNGLSYQQRKEVWAFLISAMTKYESNFKPATKFTEAFDDSSGNNVISRGLLQISIESARSYKCVLKNAEELHDPYLNLDCGLRILNRWLGTDGRIAGKVSGGWKGGARYWSVLRTTSGSYASVVSLVKNTSLCK